MDKDVSLTGQLLIAMPGIEEPFERAVVYMCAHDDDMAMGLAVNQPVEGLSLADLLSRLDVENAIRAPAGMVLLGGPVERERGFVLHPDDFDSAGSTLAIGGGLSLTTTRDVLAAMAPAAPCWRSATPVRAPARSSVSCARMCGWSRSLTTKSCSAMTMPTNGSAPSPSWVSTPAT